MTEPSLNDVSPLTGSCLCQSVTYRVTGHTGIFQYCHCSRCRKFTGSAFASNLLVLPEHFQWLSGESLVGRFEPVDTRHFATGFCTRCGSSMPWPGKTGKAVVIPAGTLDDVPDIRPTQNLFLGSQAPWYVAVEGLAGYAAMPPKKTR